MLKNTTRQVSVIVAVVATIIVNALANALPINGQTTGEISDRFQVYFVPAGYVFAIWGLIYLGLVGFAIYQALPRQRSSPTLDAIGGVFVLSSVANIVWIFLWHYNVFPLTLLAMLALLVCLIVIYLRLDIGHSAVSAAERWLVHLPFSIYLGWITVATVANFTTVLDFVGWNGFGIDPALWAVFMLAVALVVATLMALTRSDVAYLAVLVWAFVGIAVKQSATPLVALSSLVAAGAVAGLLLYSALRRRVQVSPPAYV